MKFTDANFLFLVYSSPKCAYMHRMRTCIECIVGETLKTDSRGTKKKLRIQLKTYSTTAMKSGTVLMRLS